MSQAVEPVTQGCANSECVDEHAVKVEFDNGERRSYCRYHAEHILQATSAEVVR